MTDRRSQTVWEVWCGFTPVEVPGRGPALGVSILRFMSEKDAKAVARVAKRDTVTKCEGGRHTIVKVRLRRDVLVR
jgi:hypothetical protein